MCKRANRISERGDMSKTRIRGEKGENCSLCISVNTQQRDQWNSALKPLELAVFNGLSILLIAFSG